MTTRGSGPRPGLFHPTWLQNWPALQPFEPRDLLALGCHCLLEGRHLAQQLDDKGLQFRRGECVQVTGGSHPPRESEVDGSGKRKTRRHQFCRWYFNTDDHALTRHSSDERLSHL